jgi:hypothetical protein
MTTGYPYSVARQEEDLDGEGVRVEHTTYSGGGL